MAGRGGGSLLTRIWLGRMTCVGGQTGCKPVPLLEVLHGKGADHEVLLLEAAHEDGAVLRPPLRVEAFGDDLIHDHVLLDLGTAVLPAAFGGGVDVGGHAAELLGELDLHLLMQFGRPGLSLTVSERQKDLDKCVTHEQAGVEGGAAL